MFYSDVWYDANMLENVARFDKANDVTEDVNVNTIYNDYDDDNNDYFGKVCSYTNYFSKMRSEIRDVLSFGKRRNTTNENNGCNLQY